MKIGIMPHTGKPVAMQLTVEVIEYLMSKGKIPWISEEVAALIGRPDLGRKEETIKEIDVLLVLGGDGTLLNAARTIVDYDILILGVNVGHLGFLTEIETDHLYQSLDKLLARDFHVEERMFIECQVIRDQQVIATYRALNDFVITRGTFARIIQLRVDVDDQPVVDYQADGLIVATPTGSTAYSLSAGGPIVEPSLDCLIITPICPHTLAARSVVVHQDATVTVIIEANHEEVMLTIDGQLGFPLQSLDQVKIVRAGVTGKFIKLSGRSFFDILNSRLKGPLRGGDCEE
ncbi:MAG: NAD(+)/NADH kinase [Firmicutes bacterium]|nr:NAD(+)/NADH kinase [Bacillota bacterium]